MATGWLGWSPESAWQATIPEVLVALDMKMEIQRASIPLKEKPKTPEKPKPMGDFIAKVIQMPGTKVHGRE